MDNSLVADRQTDRQTDVCSVPPCLVKRHVCVRVCMCACAAYKESLCIFWLVTFYTARKCREIMKKYGRTASNIC